MRGWKLIAAERLVIIERQMKRITELEDRLDAENLLEFKAARATEFAMPGAEQQDDDSDVWATGPFGHDPVKLPPLTDTEARYAREQGFID